MQEIAKTKTRNNTKPTNHPNCDEIMQNKIKHFNNKIRQTSKNKALKATKDGAMQMQMKHSNIKMMNKNANPNVVFLHGYNVMKSLVIEWDGVLGDDGLP